MEPDYHIEWADLGLTVVVERIAAYPRAYPEYETEALREVQQWSERNSCGKRTSFDTWQFRSDAEKTAFLLRWQ